MRLQFRSSVCFLALLFCASVAVAQAAFVNLRPRSVSSSPDVPHVKVNVDRERVPLGMQVIFTLSPANILNDARYRVTLFFGDGQQRQMKTPETTYLYSAVGTYTYSVSVKGNDLPRVTLVASSPVEERQAANFTAQVSPPLQNPQYRFVFGDGESSAWQTTSQTTHAYRTRGVYLARAEIRFNGSASAVSAPEEVKVTPPPSLSVYLTVNPPQPPPGETVTFRAKASPAQPNTQYRFSFGDGQQGFWQIDPQAQHIYQTSGRYAASVEVTQSDNNHKLSARSAPAVIAVRNSAGPTPTPTPTKGPTPQVTRTSTPSPDGSPSPTATPNGSLSANPTDKGSPSVIGGSSPTQTTAPSATDSSNPFGPLGSRGFWKYMLAAGLLLLIIYKASGLMFGAQPTFAAFSDPGMSDLADRKAGLPIDFQFVLNPNVSAGSYKVETQGTSLVQNSDRLPGREILEF